MKKTWMPDLTRRRWSKLWTNSCIGWRSKRKGLQGPDHSTVTVAQACHSCPSLSSQHKGPLAPCLWQRLWIMELYWRPCQGRYAGCGVHLSSGGGPSRQGRRWKAGHRRRVARLAWLGWRGLAEAQRQQAGLGRRTTRQGSCGQCLASQQHCSGAARVAGLWTVAGSRTCRAHRIVF